MGLPKRGQQKLPPSFGDHFGGCALEMLLFTVRSTINSSRVNNRNKEKHVPLLRSTGPKAFRIERGPLLRWLVVMLYATKRLFEVLLKQPMRVHAGPRLTCTKS